MKKQIVYFLSLAILAFACSDDDEQNIGTGLEALKDFSLNPVDGIVELNSVDTLGPVIVSWAAAESGLESTVNYTWYAYDIGGSISDALLALPSDNDGTATQITFTNIQLDDVLQDLGLDIGEQITLNWTVSATNGDVLKFVEPSTVTLKRFEDAIAPFNLSSPMNEAVVELDGANPDETVLIDWEDTFSGFGDAVTYKWQADEQGGDFSDPIFEFDSDDNGSISQLTVTNQFLDDQLSGIGLAEGESVTVMWRVVASTETLMQSSDVFQVTLRRFVSFIGLETLFLVGDATASGWENNNGNHSMFRDEDNGFKFHYIGYFAVGGFKMIEKLGQWAPLYGDGGAGVLISRPTEGDPDPPAISIAVAGYYEVIVDTDALTYSVNPFDASSASEFTSMGIIGAATAVGWDGPDIDMNKSSFDPHKWYLSDVVLTTEQMKFRADDDWTDNWGGFAFPAAQGVSGGFDNIPAEEGTYTIWFNDLDRRYFFIKQ